MHLNRVAMLLLPLIVVGPEVGAAPAPAAPDKAACIAANEEAQNLRDAKKLIDARKQYLVCAAQSCPVAVRKDCIEQAEKVEQQIPSIVPRFVDADGNDVVEVTVSVGKEILTTKLNGIAIELEPGTYDLRFESPGKPVLTQKVVLAEGEKRRAVVVSLAPAKKGAILVVNTTPAGAEVWIDGSYAGKSPVEKSVSEGEHTLRAEVSGHEPNVTTINVKSGDRRTVGLPLREKSASILSSPWFWIGTGVVVVGVGVGAYIAWTTEKRADSGTIPPGQVSAPLLRF